MFSIDEVQKAQRLTEIIQIYDRTRNPAILRWRNVRNTQQLTLAQEAQTGGHSLHKSAEQESPGQRAIAPSLKLEIIISRKYNEQDAPLFITKD